MRSVVKTIAKSQTHHSTCQNDGKINYSWNIHWSVRTSEDQEFNSSATSRGKRQKSMCQAQQH